MATRASLTKMAWNKSRLARGLCEKCPNTRAPGDATYCAAHREKRRLQTALWYRRNLRRGTEKPMKCPRVGCGGLLLKVGCDSGADGRTHDWKCQACSRRWPATEVSGPATGDARVPKRETLTAGTEAIRRAGAELAASPGGLIVKSDESKPGGARRCLGRQGRGQCKKDAEKGREYCPYHNGDTAPRERQVLRESDDGLSATTEPPGTSTALTTSTCRVLHAHIDKIDGQLASLKVRQDSLEKKRDTLHAAIAALAGVDLEVEA